ncbi:MAG TPA: HAD-IIA family hydrolase [Vicinamibacteria bacterium]|nr:HAD-IIA family hydrolase [Vicinamibacteria bacterium]
MGALLIDIDGVVLKDDQALPGAKDLVEWLLASGRRFLFLTNYPSQTPGDLAGRMASSGIEVPPRHFFTSAMATAEFLDKQAGPRRRAFVVGEGALVHELYKVGFTMSETEADFVVLGETRHYNFEMIQRAAALVQRGARFVATNPDVAGPFGRPSCGALAAPIERITGRSPFYVGKPSAFMMRAALRHMGAHSAEACMIGDNMETDIIAGVQSGMTTVLVLTGVSREADLERFAHRPDHVVRDAFALRELLERGA